MNYPFSFNQMFNPYSDNPKYLKKVFNTRLILAMTILLGVIIISLIFGDACIFGSTSSSGIILSPDEELSSGVTTAYEGLVLTFSVIVFFLPFIGLVSLLVNSGKNSSPDIKITSAPFNLFRAFFIIVLLHSLSQLASSSLYSAFAAIFSTEASDDSRIVSFLLNTIPPLTSAVWAFSGLLFCNSIIKTVRCSDLSNSAGRFFIIASFANALITLTSMILYISGGFSTGMFVDDDSSLSVKKQIMESIPSAPFMFIVYFSCCSAFLIICLLLAKRYIAGIENARASINLHGTNMYMNSDGNAAQFYSQTYTSPESNDSAPPQSQQSFDSVTVESSTAVQNIASQLTLTEIPAQEQPQKTAESTDSETYICSKCGSLNHGGNNFCYSCGNNRFNT